MFAAEFLGGNTRLMLLQNADYLFFAKASLHQCSPSKQENH
jgi:hypothetical protein